MPVTDVSRANVITDLANSKDQYRTHSHESTIHTTERGDPSKKLVQVD
jgi:hypothetical protein